MKYILTEEEMGSLVPKNDLLFEKEKVEMLVKAYRGSSVCVQHLGHCDDCPIGSLKNGLSKHTELCKDQTYSK